MKKNLFGSMIIAALLATPLATPAQTTFFSDNFAAGSTSTVNQPVTTPTGTSTSYETAINAANNTNTISATSFTVAFPSQISVVGEFMARFTNSPVVLVAPGDFLTVTVIFTNTANILVNSSGNSTLAIGLYNSGGVVPNQGVIMLNALTNSANTGGSQGWVGYVGRIIANGGNGASFTRPAQTANGTSSQNQDLIFNNASGTAGYNNPTGTALNGSTVTSPATGVITSGPTSVYTLQLSAAYNGAGSVQITNSLYVGAGTGGTLLYNKVTIATNASFVTSGFDSFAVGWRNASTAAQPSTMDVNSITVSGLSSWFPCCPFPSGPVSVVVATNGSCAFSVYVGGFNLAYQWHRNGTNLLDGGNISGATSSQLVISPAGTNDVCSGTNGYYVTVTGIGGFNINSTNASLTLRPATNLTWSGTIPTIWDLNNTAAWLDPLSNPTVFNFGDAVTFDDTGFGGNVTLTGPFLSASTVTVNGSSFTPYVFVNTSSGSFAGPGQLIYEGAGQLTIGNNNTYTGGTIITNSATKLLLQNLGGLGTGPITMAAPGVQMEIATAGATGSGIPGNVNVADDCSIQFDAVGTFSGIFNGDWSGTAGKTLTLNNSPTNTVLNQRVRLLGNSTVFNANLVLNASCVTLANYVGNNGTQIFNGVISGPGGLIQRGGGLTILNGVNTYSGGTTPTTGNIGFGIDSVGSVTSGPIGTGPLLLAPEVPNLTGSGTVLAYGGARTIANPIQYNSATNNLMLIVGGTNNLTFTGPYTLNGNDFPNGTNNVRTLQVDNTGLTTISGVISDTTNGVSAGFGLTKTGTNTLVLSNTEAYTGPTTISAGTLRVNGQLNVSSAVTVRSNATLAGTGTINGPVTVNAGGTLAPGAASIGALNLSSSLDLAGNVKVRVDRSGFASDETIVSDLLNNTGAGTVLVTNTGAALQVGDTFAVFNKAMTGGASLKVAGAGVAWNNRLGNDGTIIVSSTNLPAIGTALSGSTLTLNWPGYPGWLLQSNSVSLAATTSWFIVLNSGNVTTLDITITAKTNVFYRLLSP